MRYLSVFLVLKTLGQLSRSSDAYYFGSMFLSDICLRVPNTEKEYTLCAFQSGFLLLSYGGGVGVYEFFLGVEVRLVRPFLRAKSKRDLPVP